MSLETGLVLVAVASLLATAVLARLAWRLARSRDRALAAARSMKADLRRLSTVVEHTSNAVVGLDLGLKVLWVNEGFTRTTGWRADECIGRPIGEVFSHPDGDHSARAALRQAAVRGESCRVELLNRRKDGSAVWMNVEIQPTWDEDGRLNGWIEIALDIHHRKQAEDNLQKREHLMRVITDNIPARVSYWDADLRCRFVNQTFCHWFGHGREEVLAMTMSAEVFGADLWRNMAPSVERVLAGQPQSFELEERSASGDATTWLVHQIPDIDPVTRRTRGLFALALNVTELKQARDAAVQASQAKSQFVANMSHELRTPMNAVLGMLQLVQHTPLTEQQHSYLSKAEGAANALLSVLNDILDFSKVEAGKMALDPRPFEVDALLRDLSVIFATSVSGKPVEFVYDIHPGLPARLVADDMRLRQVLINLGGNAVKFTARGQVTLSVRPVAVAPGQVTVEFAVTDTGVGIAPDNLQRLFQDFGQAEASTTRRFGGTGLGLAICRKLVALMGGELRVDSTPGEGSCFSFRVPLVACEGHAYGEAVNQRPARRVLLVDAQPLTRQTHLQMLRMLGWQVQCAASAAQAQAALDAAPGGFDALLVDWMVDEEVPLAAARTLGAQLPVGGPSVLVLGTAEVNELLAQLEPSRQRQIAGCLTRPLTPAMIAGAVEQARAPRRDAGAAVARSQPLSGLRLLVAEDNENNQLVARELLSAQGAQVVIARDGVEAVDCMRHDGRFDAILMDWQMPRMDGLQACAEIRALGFATLPIIAMTANAMESDRTTCLAAGMNDHVAKPFVLKNLVANLLRHTRPVAPAPAPVPVPAAAAEAVAWMDPTVSLPLLDRAGALEQLGGSEALYEQLLPLFQADVRQTLEVVARALREDGDRESACRQAHTLKGTAGTVGALQLADAAREMEAALKNPPPQEQALARLRDCAERTLEALGHQLDGRLPA